MSENIEVKALVDMLDHVNKKLTKLETELAKEKERREKSESLLKDLVGLSYAAVQFPHKDMINLIAAIDLSENHFAKYAKGEVE